MFLNKPCLRLFSKGHRLGFFSEHWSGLFFGQCHLECFRLMSINDVLWLRLFFGWCRLGFCQPTLVETNFFCQCCPVFFWMMLIDDFFGRHRWRLFLGQCQLGFFVINISWTIFQAMSTKVVCGWRWPRLFFERDYFKWCWLGFFGWRWSMIFFSRHQPRLFFGQLWSMLFFSCISDHSWHC